MAEVPEGADEEGQNLVAFFYSNPLVYENTEKESRRVVKKEVNPALDYLEESRMVEKSLSDSGRQIRFCSEPATVSNVRKRLTKGCKMLHFTGHGCSESLSFEDGKAERCGIMEHLNEEKLKGLFQAGATKPELVFLVSSFSHTHGTTLTNAGVPHVVAVESKAEEPGEAARKFSQVFYHALIAHKKTVKDAFEIAVSTVNLQAPTAAATFLLLPSGGDHEVRMFNDLPEGGIVNETPKLPPAFRLPRTRRNYFGAVGLQHAVQVLQNPDAKCVSIIGEPGVGKTLRALQACHYVRERAGFDAIFYAGCKQAVIASPHPFPSMEGSRTEIERPYKQHFCRLIKSALGMPPNSLPSVRALWDFLWRSAIGEIGQQPNKILLVLDSVDILYEAGGIEARKSMIAIVDELCRTSENLKLLLTCKEQLVVDCDGCLRSTKELVHEVRPLKGRDPALLLLDPSPRDTRIRYVDFSARLGCDSNDLVERLLKLKLMEVVDGHPGTLCLLGPLFLSRDIEDPFLMKKAVRFRASFKHVRCKPFSQTRASSIAFDAGLRNRRSKLVWVGATARAEAGGQSVKDEDDACYRSVPWSCLSLDLRQSLSDLQTTGDDETQSVDDDHREEIVGSGRSFSVEGCFFSGVGLGLRGQGLGHGYVSFKPRLLSDHHLRFIRDVLRYFTSRGEGHRRGTHSFGSNAGGYDEAREGIQGEHDLNQSEDDVEDIICLETFASFCQWWWEPVMTTLSRICEEWASDNPVRVHGFIGRLEAKRKLLETDQPGVFLLRFSESRPGHLILASTYEAFQASGSHIAIRHSLITVRKDGGWTLHYGSLNDTGTSYPSLRELVLDKGNLQTLYPSFKKRSVF